MANLKKFRGFAGGGQAEVRKSDRVNIKDMPGDERRRVVNDEFGTFMNSVDARDRLVGPGAKRYLERGEKHKAVESSMKRFHEMMDEDHTHQYAKGGQVKKNVTVPKKKLIGALMAAKQAGAAQAQTQGGPPPANVPPMGMKKGGFVPFWAKKKGEDDEGKDKPKKKFAAGGMVGGRGDGCATKGKTRGTMR